MNFEDYIFKQLERKANKIMNETQDPKDQVTMDIPLFVRMLELAREDIKSDEELHQVVERVLAIKNEGVLTMDDYPDIVGTPKLPEPVVPASADAELDHLRKLAGIK